MTLLPESQLIWSDQLNEGEPLAFEDKWGKLNDANFSFKVSEGLAFETNYGSQQVFTFECWIKFPASFGRLDLLNTKNNFSISVLGSGTLEFEDLSGI
jgi:hypothetical protein